MHALQPIMKFATLRRFFFLVHMWIGLALGILFALLGLSGSMLVYDNAFADLIAPPPAAIAIGTPLSLDAVIAQARRAAPEAKGRVQLFPPQSPGQPAMVQIGELSRMGNMPGMKPHPPGIRIFIDPVSGAILGERHRALPAILIFAHQLHGNFLMGRAGRSFVGWLGIAMLAIGLSGLVLWWPKRGQWKYAFRVRRTANGARFYRDLHATVGIWAFIVFMAVSFSGVAIAFPDAMRTMLGASVPPSSQSAGPRGAMPVRPVAGVAPMSADAAAAMLHADFPGATLTSVTMPEHRSGDFGASLTRADGRALMVHFHSWSASVTAAPDPVSKGGATAFLAWQRPLHEGLGLGPVWRVLVFLSGFLPALFVVTGVLLWGKKYRRHIAMNAPLD